MPSLFKSVTVLYRTKDGKRAKKGEPGAIKKRVVSKAWYGRYKDGSGRRRTVCLCGDKEAAKQLLHKLSTDASMQRHGLSDPFAEHRHKPLLDHLEDYRRFLRAKGNTEKHVGHIYARAKAIIEGCKFTRIDDLQPSAIVEWLGDQRKKTSNKRCLEGMSIQTSNFYLQAIKQFAKWLVKDRRTGHNPLNHLEGGNVRLDRRHDRRTLCPSHFAAFIEAARHGKTFRRLTGSDRVMLYLVAANTGLRESELASLSPESFRLDHSPPLVTVAASYSKHKEEDTVPLRADVAELVRGFLVGREPGKPLWPGSWTEKGGRMVRLDLEAAGITYRDTKGLVFDFHALRHQFITNLALGGVHPKVAQELARHGDIKLTMKSYTHLQLRDIAGSLDKLPPLPSSNKQGEDKATDAG